MPRDGRIVRERLRRAAYELFAERGFDATTTEQIAARAGVTERTYFRHFPDKREVLFASEEELRELTVAALAAVPSDTEPMPALQVAFHAAVPLIERNRPTTEMLGPIIAVTPALLERQHAKAASLVALVTQALEGRGVSERTAVLCARVGMDAFSTAIRRWMPGVSDLHDDLDESFEELKALSASIGTQQSSAR